MSVQGIEGMLQDMRTMATRATAGMGESAASKTVGQSSEFAALLKQSLDKVNQALAMFGKEAVPGEREE